jgi:hypothetical protein
MKANASESYLSRSTSDIRIAILSSNRGGHLQALLKAQSWVKIALVVAGSPELRYV